MKWLAFDFSACRLPGGISIWSYYFRLLCSCPAMCTGFVGFSNLSISDINSSHLWKHDVNCRAQPHQTSPNNTAWVTKLWRKWSLNVGVSLLFVNVFPSDTEQFRCVPHPVKCIGSGDVPLFGIDRIWMQEKLFQVSQVALDMCLGSSCIYWDSDDGWWLRIELYIRGWKRSFLKQGKLPFWDLCWAVHPCCGWAVYADWLCTRSSLSLWWVNQKRRLLGQLLPLK